MVMDSESVQLLLIARKKDMSLGLVFFQSDKILILYFLK